MMDRRTFAIGSLALGGSALALSACGASSSASENPSPLEGQTPQTGKMDTMPADENIDWANLTRAEWQDRLTEEEFYVLRREGTERPWTSPLNDEKRNGTYCCAGCGQALFKSDTKFDSGTGWPSFFDTIDGAVNTKRDFKLVVPRTEYHCSRCGGHQGHVFKDGPRPTGLRYCNNGIALDFVPEDV